MSLEVNTGDNVKYNGETVKVASESSAYITVVTEDGERISVAKSSALLSFANNSEKELQQILEENKQEIKDYKKAWTNAKDQKWSFIDQISSFWKNLGITSRNTEKLNSEQLTTLDGLKEKKADAISTMRNASTGVYETVFESLCAIHSYRA